MNTLLREEIVKVIEGKGAAERIPLLYDIWIYDNVFHNNPKEREAWLSKYPCDIDRVFLEMPGMTEETSKYPEYCWAEPGIQIDEAQGIDNRCLIEDWDETDRFYETFPDSGYPEKIGENYAKDGRYRLGMWWYCFFERLWSLRGMENALTDFYIYPDEVHKLFRKLTDFYMTIMERAKNELDVDGFFVSDDIGTQNAPFFSLEIFREFFKPYYKKLIEKAHELGAHFWLHSCGNIELFLDDFVEIGLDVIHPIQKHTMDEKRISEKYGDRICILSGIDVQYLMAFGTTEEVKEEVNYLKKTFQNPNGRFMMTMGNGSTEDWKIENLDAMYEAALNKDEGI